MRSRLGALLGGLILLAAGGGCAARADSADAGDSKAAETQTTKTPSPAASETSGNRYALLVGCTTYDHNDLIQLVGPANDVTLMRRVLTDKKLKFNFPNENIVELSENPGAKGRPTHDNIHNEFAELAKKAKAGDQVFILLSGHGCHQPAKDPLDEKYPRPDGMDQTFLPADIGDWDGEKATVANAIPDYELRQWCKAITRGDKGAALWIVVDSCCSGFTLRGNSEEVARRIDPEKLKIPAAAMDAAQQRAAQGEQTRGGPTEAPPLFALDDQSPNFVGLYAAQPDEPTVEMPLPKEEFPGVRRVRHGLLTYTMCEILERSETSISYAELHRLICNAYRQMKRTTGPRPLVEGLARDKVVLGSSRSNRSNWSLQPPHKADDASAAWTVNAGLIHGLTPGSILAVFPPPDKKSDAKQPLGYVRVSQSDRLEAEVTPWDRAADKPLANADFLQPEAVCKPVYLEYGDMRIKVAVDNKTGGHEKAQDASPRFRQIKQDLQKLAAPGEDQPGRFFELTDDTASADWVVQERDGEALLLSRDAAQIVGPLAADIPRFVLPADKPADAAVEHIATIFRAQNLLGLTKPTVASQGDSLAAANATTDPDAIRLKVELLKLKDRQDKVGTDLLSSGKDVVLLPGDLVRWRITNIGRREADVTLLYVDTSFKVSCVFPRRGEAVENRLVPVGAGGRPLTIPARIDNKTIGAEHLAIIAIAHEGQPRSFSFLAEPTSAGARAVTRGASNGLLKSPFGRFCEYALYGEGQTRGMDFGDPDDVTTDLIEWRVVKR